MSDISTSFRSSTPAPSVVPQDSPTAPEPNDIGAATDLGVEEPVEGNAAEEALLEVLGVDDSFGMPSEDTANLKDVTEYVMQLVKQRGATPTPSTMKRAIDGIKEELGLDPQAEPTVVLERVGNIVKAWKGLTFVRDLSERRRIMMRLSRLPDSKSVDEALFQEMDRKGVYR